MTLDDLKDKNVTINATAFKLSPDKSQSIGNYFLFNASPDNNGKIAIPLRKDPISFMIELNKEIAGDSSIILGYKIEQDQ